jgi:hypothetical protein
LFFLLVPFFSSSSSIPPPPSIVVLYTFPALHWLFLALIGNEYRTTSFIQLHSTQPTEYF